MRAVPRAFSKKFPGFNKVTGYKFAKHIESDVLVTMK